MQTMIDSKGAKARLMWAWFEAHPNQPMPEGRREVEALFEVIEAASRATAELERDQQERFKWAANERADSGAGLDEEVLAQAVYWVYGTADDARQVVVEYVRRVADLAQFAALAATPAVLSPVLSDGSIITDAATPAEE